MNHALSRLTLIGVAFVFTALPAQAQDLGSLDGTWEGSLVVGAAPSWSGESRPYTVRMTIAGATARVFARYGNSGPFQELKPGAFHLTRHGPNGVIAALDQGQDDDGTWVETWAFAVTLKTRDALITNLYRVVNNVDLPLSVSRSKFTEAQAGELFRTK